MKETKKHEAYDMMLRDKKLFPVIAYGSAGTGKTYGAVGAAVEWLDKHKNNKVLVTRPNVSFAKELGFLPGDTKDKLMPWVAPVRQNFKFHGLDDNMQEVWEKKGRIEYIALEHIQGLTFDNTFIIVDEVQNMTFDQLKVFLTRIGKWSKVVLCGDIAQVSPKFKGSGLAELIKMIKHFNMNVHTVEFTSEDILRSEQCKAWIENFEKWEEIKESK